MSGRHQQRPPLRVSACSVALLLGVAACSDIDSADGAPTTPLAPLITTAPATAAPTTAAPTTAAPTTAAPTTAAPTTAAPTTTLPPVTTTTFPFVNDGAYVIVANAADVPGAASTYTESLAEYGFAMLEPTNGAGPEEIIEVTRVYARPEPEAQAVGLSVARVLGGIALERMPTPAPITDATAGLGEATVLVMLGRDLAKQPLPGPPTD